MSYDKEPEPIKWQNVQVPESYTGPRFEKVEDITAEWYPLFVFHPISHPFRVAELMEYQKNEKNLHKRYVWQILETFKENMTKLQNCVHI